LCRSPPGSRSLEDKCPEEMKGFSFPRWGMTQRHGPRWDAGWGGWLVLSPACSPSEERDGCCHLVLDFRLGSFAAWLWSWQMPWFCHGSWPSEISACLYNPEGVQNCFDPHAKCGELKQKCFPQFLFWPKPRLEL